MQDGLDVTVHVLEGAEAGTVRHDVLGMVANGGWRRRPELAVLLTQVEHFPGRIRHRVVVPGRQAEVLRVVHPGAAGTGLGDAAAHALVRDHVRPRCRWQPIAPQDHAVVALLVELMLEGSGLLHRPLRGTYRVGGPLHSCGGWLAHPGLGQVEDTVEARSVAP